MRIPRIA